tara:strand:- start:1086 stop:3377 length:2292 start_codon:yes stop_codon:yes gene_type:complete
LATPEITALTQRIRESIKLSDDTAGFTPEELQDRHEKLAKAKKDSNPESQVLPDVPTVTTDKTTLYTWGDDDTEKLLDEITREIIRDLESIDPIEDGDQDEFTARYTQIQNILLNPTNGLFGGRGHYNADYIETSPEYAGLEPILQSSAKSVVKFEKLIKKNGKNRTHLNFKQSREQQYIEEFLEQEIISPEIYDALQGRGTKFIDDGIQEEAAALMSSLIRKESELTTTILNTYPDTSTFRSGIGRYVTAANPNDIRSGIFNDVAATLPLVENVIRDQIEQSNLEAMREAFATNANLANAVTDILGPVMVATDDEDKIEANTRKRLINYLESIRTSLKNSDPSRSDQELGRLLHSALMEARSKGPVDEAGMPGQSLIDQMRNQEIGIVTNKKDTAAYNERKAAWEAEMKRLQGASKSDGLAKAKEYLANQFTLDTTISAEGLNKMAAEWYQQQQDALARGGEVFSDSEIFGQFNASILGPGGFIDQGWADQAVKNPSLMYETYTDPNNPERQLKVSDAANRSGYQMAPSGQVGEFGTRFDPVRGERVGGATYIDPNTGRIAVDQFGNPILLKGKEILDNAHLVDPLTLFNYFRTMEMTPGEIENMGRYQIPSFPMEDFSALFPDRERATKGEMMYTPEPVYGYDEITGQPNYAANQLDEQGNVIQRPIYPYADPSEPVDIQGALPGSEGADFERFAPFLPQPEPQPRLPHPDHIPPPPTPAVVGSSFDLSPFDQGMKDVLTPPEPVDPISAIDFMALSEPEF